MQAFVLHSGGIDSTTCLYLAVKEVGVENVTAFSVDYGQRHSREIQASETLCRNLGVKHQTLTLGGQPKSALTDETREIPRMSYDDMGYGMSPSYHHFRNGQLLALVAAYSVAALEEDETGEILWGAHAEDAVNWAYADCTPSFVNAIGEAIKIGTYRKIHLRTPLVESTKAEVIALGENLGVDWANTWSCYLGGVNHCGTCPTCRARREAFELASVEDPTVYDEVPSDA